MDILAIDDDPIMLHTIHMVLEESFGEILTSEHPNRALPYFESHDIRLILLDLNFSIGDSDGAEGLAWIKRIKERFPDTIVIILTAHGFIEIAVKAIKQGATDFLEKPFSNEKLIATVQAGINLANAKKEAEDANTRTEALIHQTNQMDHMIVGDAQSMKTVMQAVNKVAHTDASLLITGAHGTGKEMLARYIHQRSERAAGPFIHADLGAVTHSLFESTLFGHVRGAFTDASQDKAGLVEAANMGTLLLDEIGSLPLNLQSKLLSVLQSREVNRVGENRSRAVDLRLISTSHLSLEELSSSAQFRQDLLYRINTVHIHLPTLRNRKDDIKPLSEHFLSQFNKKYKSHLQFSKDDLKALERQKWPGNVRELKNSIERMVVLNQVQLIPETPADRNADNLYEVEKRKIAEVIKRHSGNITHAAAELGIGRNTLYRKMKKYDL